MIMFRLRQTRHLGKDQMWKAAKSVVGHERDHKTASIEQRLKYHENCSSHTNCTFWTHVNIDKLPPSDFVFNRKTANGDSVEGGILHLDIFDQYPQAYDDLVWKFYYDTNFLKEGVIAGMKYYVTSNANESIHQKIWNRLFKIKSHSLERTLFIFQKVLMINNFGYYRSSLYHVLGMMGPLATRMLKKKDKESFRHSKNVYSSKLKRLQTKYHKVTGDGNDKIDDDSEGYAAGMGDPMSSYN
ncbi:unnamed protein product [Meganyctiphanes norvegica]|uniref:Uncharacterized protein n=1 Tax=Meganyctiphanes norvegica TaxID=48144 RepID=A0AAV2PLG9_MEGNR